MSDVTISAPAAQGHVPRDPEAVLRQQLQQTQMAAGTITNIAAALVRQLGGDEVRLPPGLVERMAGAKIEIRQEVGGSVLVKLCERAPDLIVIGG